MTERDYDALDLAEVLARIQGEVQRFKKAIAEAEMLVEELDTSWFFTAADGDRRGTLAVHPAAV